MSDGDLLKHLVGALTSVTGLFNARVCRAVIIGGVAASLQGRVRTTKDVDALVLDEDDRLPDLLRQASEFGLVPRRSDALDFARQRRVLLLQHQSSGIGVDVSLGLLPFEVEVYENSRVQNLFGLQLRVAAPDDLIIMKAVAHRKQDLADIEAILELQSGLDLGRIRRWVKDFAAVLEMPEIYDDLESLLSGRR